MGTEVKPLGVTCNIQCQYCYQNPTRDAGNLPRSYDLSRIKSAIEAAGRPFSLFGGEPLLMPKQDLADLWAWGLAKFGRNSIQTNGTLIDDDHVRMFKDYHVGVGLSLDGPGALNDARWAGTLQRTRRATARAEAAVERLAREGLMPSIIITLNRANAAFDKLPALFDWVRYLDEMGVRRVRLHLLEEESPDIKRKYGLSTDENIHALLGFASLERALKTLRFDVLIDMRNLLTGRDDRATCVWQACDPYTTEAVGGVESDGEPSNCGRTNKDGIEYIKSDTPGFERYIALYRTPQQYGGCNGCRFFLMCKGQCPGTAINGDWRNRTEYCEVWKAVFGVLEGELIISGGAPLSINPRRHEMEGRFLQAWSTGSNASMIHFQLKDPTSSLASARLDVDLPNFVRVSWAHSTARRTWETRLRRIGSVWTDIEARSVAERLRDGALLAVRPPELQETRERWRKAGLAVENMGFDGQPVGGLLPAVRVAVARNPRVLAQLYMALRSGADRVIGRLLGYPDCCCSAFEHAKHHHRQLDGTFIPLRNLAGDIELPALLSARGDPSANIFWSQLGLRAIPHFPCAFDCAKSLALAQRLIALGRRLGYGEEMDWLLEILAWPVQWSALHGIAELKSPVLKLSTRTDATLSTCVASWQTPGIAREDQPPLKPRLTGSVAHQRGIDNRSVRQSQFPGWYYTDNGFSSLVGMSLNQAPIVRTAERALSSKRGNILDLGCGNGALLQKICLRNRALKPFGIDENAARIEHAHSLMPAFAAEFVVGSLLEAIDIFPNSRYLLALLMLDRVLLAPLSQVDRFLNRLADSAEKLLVYVYNRRHPESIELLAARVGLRVSRTISPTIAMVSQAD
jgi:uncharacterized protein